MEPGIRKYLLRIVNTLSLGLLWLAINSTAGIMYDYAFVHETITMGNVFFYLWFLISLAAYLWYVIRIWSKPIDFQE